MKKLIGLKLFLLLAISSCTALPCAAQEIEVRLSVKFILDASGNRPSGTYSSEQSIRDVIERSNRTLHRWGRGYRYVITEIREVAGASEYFDLDEAMNDKEYYGLEDAARKDTDKFCWRENATNVFIVNTWRGANGPSAAAIPSAPNDQRGSGQAPYELVVMTISTGPEIIWLHELGHHNDLYHTFDDGKVADTRPDPTPFQCKSGDQVVECDCATKLKNLKVAADAEGWSQQEYDDIRWNIMSYHCNIDFLNGRRTEGQLDRWADGTRRYHRGEVSGVTYFVDGNNPQPMFTGYSISPFPTIALGLKAANPEGGDIVLIRGGSYNVKMTINQKVTLRTGRGSVATIGR